MKRGLVGLVLLAVLVPGGSATARPVAANTNLTVFAAASLTDAFPMIGPRASYSFGGSNALAAQIRLGAPADVFASANMALPNGLHKDRLCSKPVVFTRNKLVVIVPRSNPAGIGNVYDLRESGVKIVIAAQGVPVGSYTLQVLRNMNLTSVLSNVVSRESDVREVLAKVALDEADAGFVYSTDARTVPSKVRAIKIPAWAQPKVQYGICVVTASSHKAAARAFVKRVLGPTGQRILVHHGFVPRVKPRP
jgi:molybdate transport system substrate-binding protein